MKSNDEQMLRLEADARDLKEKISELWAGLRDSGQELPSIEQFLKLAKDAGSKAKAANKVSNDHISLIFFLNLVLDNKKLMSHKTIKAFSVLEKA